MNSLVPKWKGIQSHKMLKLSADQIDAYHRDGFLALDELVREEEVVWMREVYDRLFATRAGRERGDQFDLGGEDREGVEPVLPQILSPSSYAPELLSGQYRQTADSVIKQLLGPSGSLGGDHAINKPARIGAATPWHQDEAYWDPSLDYNSLSIWIPLQEATIENGCMWFIPGSQKWEVHPHQPIGNNPKVHGLEMLEVDTSTAVACPLPSGGCTIHHNRTAHYTGPNLSDAPRRALILGGGVAATKRTDDRRFPWNEMKTTARQERREAYEARTTE